MFGILITVNPYSSRKAVLSSIHLLSANAFVGNLIIKHILPFVNRKCLPDFSGRQNFVLRYYNVVDLNDSNDYIRIILGHCTEINGIGSRVKVAKTRK